MVEINKHQKITISIYGHNGLYFAVGVSENTGKILKCNLPKLNKQDAINEIIKDYSSFEISDKYQKLAKDVCRTYYGEKVHFDVDIPGKSGFKRKVLQEVAKIPFGEIRTYKQVAESINTKAYRAVGTAIGRNPLPIIIPCHRVVKSDLRVGGFYGGTEIKKEILENEGICIVDGKIIKKE